MTVKFRLGIDDDHLTFLDTARIAEAEGVAWVALHARTALQHYAPPAHWERIAELKAAIGSIPVLGNGDVFCPDDARSMMALDRLRRRRGRARVPGPTVAVRASSPRRSPASRCHRHRAWARSPTPSADTCS